MLTKSRCDFDIIAGSTSGVMIPDAEVLAVVVEVLRALDLGKFVVKVNHRRLLDSMVALAGIEPAKFKTVCSSIDKLDKEPWSKVREELVGSKGIRPEAADELFRFVNNSGKPDMMIAYLKEEKLFGEHKGANDALREMETLFEYLGAMGGVCDNLSFDLSLARGLDYYTGLIYEAVLTEGSNVGSIAGGGRYDDLIGMFAGKSLPAVGVSIGIERVFSILEEKALADSSARASETQVLVASTWNGMTKHRFAVCAELWRAGIKVQREKRLTIG